MLQQSLKFSVIFGDVVRPAEVVARDDDAEAPQIEVEAGEDLEQVHSSLLSSYGAGIEVHVEAITPGEAVRVRGRVRSVVSDGSPHRGAAWSAVIGDAEIERS